jgi:hypothetical protein
MRALVLALLLPALANAQPVVGPEISSAPFFSFGPAVDEPTPALGIVRSGSGFALTWAAVDASGRSRVFVALLNAEATTLSTRVLPALEAASDAFHPAIASHGAGFLVAWTEIGSNEPRGVVATARLDSSGTVIGSPRQLTPGLMAPIVHWTGADYYIGTGSILWAVSADGSNTRAFNQGVMIDSISGTASQVVVGGHSIGVEAYLCFHGCPPPHAVYVAQIVLVGDCSTSWSFAPPPSLGTTASFDGQNYLVVWPDNDGTLRAFRVGADCKSLEARDALLVDHFFSGGRMTSTPQPAWDGSRFLVVYQSSPSEIRGAFLHDGESDPPFVVANGSVRRPSVIDVGAGKFLVAYEMQSAEGTQLAGRFIDFPPPRRRVAK